MWLVLTRGKSEEVVIGDVGSPIGFIRVIGVRGGKVRLAFSSGFSQVHRGEVASQIQRSRRQKSWEQRTKEGSTANVDVRTKDPDVGLLPARSETNNDQDTARSVCSLVLMAWGLTALAVIAVAAYVLYGLAFS